MSPAQAPLQSASSGCSAFQLFAVATEGACFSGLTATNARLQAGLVSSWLHDNLEPGREILFRGVDGDFTLDRAAKCIPAAGDYRGHERGG